MDKAKKYNYSKGRAGELEAKKLLMTYGFEFVEANYRNKIGEIDLIMKDKDYLVFVEVKLKVGDKNGRPEEMIDKRKLWQVKKTAKAYCIEKGININKSKLRIDAVCIVKNDDKTTAWEKHYTNLY